jgi:mono/diheme cytochrome c family protein
MPRRITMLILACAFGGALAASGALGQAAAPAKDGKTLFLDYKCNSCHAISAQQIVKKEDKSEESESKSKKKPPDLSGVGKKRTADWIAKYMNKLETIEKEKHPKKFKGTEAELKTLATWLETLKIDKKGAKS